MGCCISKKGGAIHHEYNIGDFVSDDMILEGVDEMIKKYLPEKTYFIAMKGLTDFEFGDPPEDYDN